MGLRFPVFPGSVRCVIGLNRLRASESLDAPATTEACVRCSGYIHTYICGSWDSFAGTTNCRYWEGALFDVTLPAVV